MNKTYISIAVMVLAAVLPRIGVNLGDDTLTTVVEVLVQIGFGLTAFISHKNVVGKARLAGVQF